MGGDGDEREPWRHARTKVDDPSLGLGAFSRRRELGLTEWKGRVRGVWTHLGGRVGDVDLAEDRVTVVGEHDTCGGEESGSVSVGGAVEIARRWWRPRETVASPSAHDRGKVVARGVIWAGVARHAPPEASRIIFSMERGPSVVRMISATACGGAQRRGRGVQSRVFARRPSVARGMWRLAPNARGGFDRRSGSWGWGIRDATHLSSGDVVQLRGATGLTLRVGVWMGRRGAIGQSMDSRGGRGKPEREGKCFFGWAAGQISSGEGHSLITMMGLCMPCILTGRSLVNSATLLGWIQAARCGGAS